MLNGAVPDDVTVDNWWSRPSSRAFDHLRAREHCGHRGPGCHLLARRVFVVPAPSGGRIHRRSSALIVGSFMAQLNRAAGLNRFMAKAGAQ